MCGKGVQKVSTQTKSHVVSGNTSAATFSWNRPGAQKTWLAQHQIELAQLLPCRGAWDGSIQTFPVCSAMGYSGENEGRLTYNHTF